MTRTSPRRRRWSRAGAGAMGTAIAVAMMAALLSAPAASSSPTTSAPASGVMWGAYANAKPGQTIFEAVTALENKVDREIAIANKYHPFTDHSYGFEAWQLDRAGAGLDEGVQGRLVRVAHGARQDLARLLDAGHPSESRG